MRRVAMVITNPYEPDVRAQKEAHTLALAGYRVTIIAWDRAGQMASSECEAMPAALDEELSEWDGRTSATPEPVSVVRISVPAGYRTGRRLLLALPRFWWRALHELRRIQPDVVHAHDLDTLPVAYAYKRWAGAPMVYDAREYYPGMVRASVGAVLSGLLDGLDSWLTPRADAVVTVGERLAERLRQMGGRVWVVHNSQSYLHERDVEDRRRMLRHAWGVPDDAVVVVYVGYLTPDRLVAPLLEAVPSLEGVWAVIAGDGPQMAQVQAAAAACPRVRALGRVPLADVPAVVAASDVVYYGLDAINRNSTYFMPNLAFFALAAGRPILTTPVGEVADMVRREGCGIVLAAPSAEAVRQGLLALSTPAARVTFEQRARFIREEHYRWRYAAGQLAAAYESLRNVKKDKEISILGVQNDH